MSYVVTNPAGEEYIVPSETFEERYKPTDTEGIYSAEGYVRAIKNPYEKEIEFLAEWGELVNGDTESMLAYTTDSHGNRTSDPYIIDATVFAETYKPAS